MRMKCNKCGEEINLYEAKIKHVLETGELGIPIWIVVEYWKTKQGSYDYTRREIRAIELNEEIADKRVDYLNHIYEDRYMVKDRPIVRSERNYLGHFFAMSMDYVTRKIKDVRKDRIEMISTRKWNEEIGEVEITNPLSDAVICKMLLKYGEKMKVFSLYEFTEVLELNEDRVTRIMEQLIRQGIFRFKQEGE